jgi:hypothetical protein
MKSAKQMNQSFLQRTYGRPKPVREFKRFHKIKLADTGQDPDSGYIEFMKHDVIKPLHRDKDKTIIHNQISPEKWALNTTKKAATIEKLPKIQQFKDLHFAGNRDSQTEYYKNTFLPTDNIAIKVPRIVKTETENSFLNLKSKLGAHSETYEHGWVPKTSTKSMANTSSVAYNIVNNSQNTVSGCVEYRILDKKLANRKKGVGEFHDLCNFDPKDTRFKNILETDKNIFNIRNGIFSHMYDAAHRNGNLSIPFKKKGVTIQVDR